MKVMDELRRENENLKVLYADLEGQFKDKQVSQKLGN
jgi:predicted phosphoadenosine phosphosulfate sulfurtransferase